MRWLLASVLVCGVSVFAEDYLAEGVDNRRTGWLKNEKVFTTANVGSMKLLWKIKVNSTPRQMHNLFAPLAVSGVTTARGARELAIFAGISDRAARDRRRHRRDDLGKEVRQHLSVAHDRRRQHVMSRRTDRRACHHHNSCEGQVHALYTRLVGRPPSHPRCGHGCRRGAAGQIRSPTASRTR